MYLGYVFICADAPVEFSRINQTEHVYSVLQYSDGDGNLRGEDRAFARWAFDCDGHIGLSRALLVGDRTRIIDGPLKDYEGVIIRIDRHKRFAWVNVPIGNDVKPIRMYFEWLTAHGDGQMVLLQDTEG